MACEAVLATSTENCRDDLAISFPSCLVLSAPFTRSLKTKDFGAGCVNRNSAPLPCTQYIFLSLLEVGGSGDQNVPNELCRLHSGFVDWEHNLSWLCASQDVTAFMNFLYLL